MNNDEWFHDTDRQASCRLLETLSLWADTLVRVWLPDRDTVIPTQAMLQAFLENRGFTVACLNGSLYGEWFDELFVEAMLHPDRLEPVVDEVVGRIRERASSAAQAKAIPEMTPLLLIRLEGEKNHG